ncbi:hypothetical protein BU25DRAFT_722 [Macroventuria anomochaeta]|uniref:Uncharacterized protein n=1 Tax=Macroventuria anomochaeta TaxID=301207 RepID=A0ACB6SFS9_9PLEO|nr:uncharacterized protein BU25DRAFT_722 [Macroventuria anomochaeta]KAF2633165.1 hypothetical protein BU25DRAFT_722 [Macroventuria anomochaeta]
MPADFDSLSKQLLHHASLVQAPQKAKNEALTGKIADMNLHPTLESALHILNHDLPSAHFLVRHMQAPPALEGMLTHSILHRCEGDFRNARLWLGDVGDAAEGWVPKKREQEERLSRDVAEKCKGGKEIEKSLLEWVYGAEGVEAGKTLVDDVEGWRKRKGGESEEGRLKERIREEMGKVLEWCVKKFGTQQYTDASSAWVKNSEEVQKISNDMVSGDKGHRRF